MPDSPEYFFDDECLRSHSPTRINEVGYRQASIAIVLARRNNFDSVLFIQRAISPKDPWSGQIACPGGGQEPHDKNAMHTAIRETEEEVGLVLRPSQLLCRLDDQQGRSHNQSLPLCISAFVFRIAFQQVEDAPLTPNYEVASEFWVPLPWLTDELRRVAYQTPFRPEPYEAIRLTDSKASSMDNPNVEYGNDRILWGLTYRFIQQLIEI